MASRRYLSFINQAELNKLSESDKKLLREQILTSLNDKEIKRMLMQSRIFDDLVSGLDPKVKRRLKAKIRPLKNRLLKDEPAVKAQDNVVTIRRSGR